MTFISSEADSPADQPLGEVTCSTNFYAVVGQAAVTWAVSAEDRAGEKTKVAAQSLGEIFE